MNVFNSNKKVRQKIYAMTTNPIKLIHVSPYSLAHCPNIIHSLKYQRFTTSSCKDKGIRKLEFVIIANFLSKEKLLIKILVFLEKTYFFL